MDLYAKVLEYQAEAASVRLLADDQKYLDVKLRLMEVAAKLDAAASLLLLYLVKDEVR